MSSLNASSQAISSGLSSVTSGISQTKVWGDPHVMNEAIRFFAPAAGDAFSSKSVQKFKNIPVADQAAISPPAEFYKNLPAEQPGSVNVKELHSKLIDSKLNLNAGLDGLKTQMEDEIKKWEEKLNSVGDDAQLANVDLQNILQKQQQTLQMLSNISKMLFDTASSVIRKIGS